MHPVFGYGSLLNRSTLPSDVALQPATIRGWVRQWRNPYPVERGRMCFLTVQRRPNATPPGTVLSDGPPEFDRIVSERESGDLIVPVACRLDQGRTLDANVFVAPDENLHWASAEAPICLSYLDCVLQGYLHVYGRAGVEEFLATTEGWYLPLVDDRDDPVYPRSIALAVDQLSLIDSCLRSRDLVD